MDTVRSSCRNGNIVSHTDIASVNVLQLTSRVSEGESLPQLPRLLAVYPTVSSTPQLDVFADVWRGYGSVKQLQVLYSDHTISDHMMPYH